MKTTVKKLSETRVEVKFVLDKEELEIAEQVALKRLSRDIKVAGFRKGHVPLDVARKNLNPNALNEQTLENAISKAVAEGFMGEGLQALERPEVEIKKYVPGESVEFTAEATVLPEVKLGDYKKLKATPSKVSVTKADVDDIVKKMQDNFAAKKEVERAAKTGDEAVIDFVGKKDGKEFDGGKAEGYSLKLGAGQFIPGFEEGIVGHKAGEEFSLDLEFPAGYHVKDLAGQKVTFDVTLRTLFELELPELNDEFAAKCGPFTSIDEMREDIKREIEANKQREVESKYRDELVSELADKTKVELPELLIDDQMRSIEHDMQQNLSYQGASLDDYLASQNFKDKDAWMKVEVRPAAEKRVKAGLVLAQLSKELDVDVSREELDKEINTLKEHYGKDAKTAKQFEDPNVHRDIANRLITDKTIAKLVEVSSK